MPSSSNSFAIVRARGVNPSLRVLREHHMIATSQRYLSHTHTSVHRGILTNGNMLLNGPENGNMNENACLKTGIKREHGT